jgi:hypothetical protein
MVGGLSARQRRVSRELLPRRLAVLPRRVSDNVGGVKQFSSTPQHALVEERHFALVEAVAFSLPTKARS